MPGRRDPLVGVRRPGGAVERGYGLDGEDGAIVGAYDVDLRSGRRPARRGAGGLARARSRTAPEQCVGVEDRLLENERRSQVTDSQRMVEPGGLEGGGRDRALPERRAEGAERIGRANVSALESHAGQHALEGKCRLAFRHAGLRVRDTVGIRAVLRPAQGLRQRERRRLTLHRTARGDCDDQQSTPHPHATPSTRSNRTGRTAGPVRMMTAGR